MVSMGLQQCSRRAPDWNVVMMDYTPFRRCRSGRCCEVALYVRQHLECIQLCLGMDDEWLESLWVKIEEQTSTGACCCGVFATGHLIRTRKWTKPSRGNLKGTGPASCAGLKLPWNVLEKQHGKVLTTRRFLEKHRCETGSGESHKERCAGCLALYYITGNALLVTGRLGAALVSMIGPDLRNLWPKRSG